MKTCGKCGIDKPHEDFSVDRRAKTGRYWCCKDCHKAAAKTYKVNVPIEVRRERWRQQNKTPAAKAKWKRYYDKNRDKYQQWNREWREQNADLVKQQWAVWYEENGEQLRARRAAEYDPVKKRETRNPEQGLKDSAKRRARLAQVEYEYINRAKLFERDEGKCRICGKAAPKNWEMDHIVPIALGGPHIWSNVQVTCRPCNRQKWKALEGQIALPA